MNDVVTAGEHVRIYVKTETVESKDQPLDGVIEATSRAAVRIRSTSQTEVFVIPWDMIQALEVDVIPVRKVATGHDKAGQ